MLKQKLKVLLGVFMIGLLIFLPTTTAFGSSSGVPNFTLPSVQGGNVRLYDVSATVIVLNFWGTWCYWCRIEIPDFIQVSAEFKDKGVVFIGVSDDADRTTVQNYIQQVGINYMILHDPDDSVTVGLYGISGWPTTIVLNANKEEVFRQVGVMSKAQIESAISKALEQAGSTASYGDLVVTSDVNEVAAGKKATFTVTSYPQGTKKVQFFMDGKLKKTDKKAPFVGKIKVTSGQHTVTIVALDKNKNMLDSQEITFVK
jgi:peroxiredoxin